MRTESWPLLLTTVWMCVLGCAGEGQTEEQFVPTYQVRVLNVYPHDRTAFTQGLAVEGNVVYEGTGQYGKSTLRQADLESGRIEKSVSLPPEYFGEGITIFGRRIYQLTWKERICVVYDKVNMQPLGTLNYTGQGWGLADDEQHIYVSDGTNTIRVVDPQTFKVIRRFRVKHGRRYVDELNELEFVDGKLLANIWYSDKIAEIDPATGNVTAWIDCSGIYPASTRPDREHVLNGIAHDEATGRLFVTGKNWPRLYEIEIVKTAN